VLNNNQSPTHLKSEQTPQHGTQNVKTHNRTTQTNLKDEQHVYTENLKDEQHVYTEN